MRVLLVEDQGGIGIDMTSVIRRSIGAKAVEIKGSVAQAKARLEQGNIDMVVMDYQLGAGENGADLARWMCDQPALTGVWRVLWSATTLDRIAPEAERARLFHETLDKGITPLVMRARIAAMLDVRSS